MKLTATRSLALLALVAGAAAAISGSPLPAPARNEVSAVDLATWIRARQPGLLVVDARAAAQADEGSVPGALPLAEIEAGRLGEGATVVIYAEAEVEAGVVAALQRQSAAPRYLRLHGGYKAWREEVLFPVVRSDASAAQLRRFEQRAQLSRYFGGSPRQLDPGVAVAQARSRRGC
jgi:rhodanese-related sulfurtransferase